MTSSVASRPGFLRWLVTAGDPATLVATFSTAAGSPVNLSGSTVAAACANWSTSHAGSATVGGASNNEVTVAFTDTITGQLTGGGWTWTLTVDGVTTLAGPLDVAQPGVAGVTGGDASAVVVVDDVNVAVTVTTTGGGGAVDSVNGQTGVVVLGAADVSADPAGTAAGLVDDLSGVTAPATARSNLGLGTAAVADTGTGAANVIVGSDARLTDARTPTTHAATHADGGSDEISIDASQITSGTVATARLGSGTADATTFLRGDQTWATPPSGVVVGNCRVFSPRPSGYGWAMWSGNQSILASNTVQSASLPFTVSEAATLTILRIDVSTGSAGATHLMSLCECSPNGEPGDLIETFPAFDCSTTGEKSLSGLSTPLDRGSYYVFASLGGPTSGHTLRGVSTGGGGLSLTLGGTLVLETTTTGVQTGGAVGRGAGWRNTMPTPGVPISQLWGHALTNISIPNIGLVLT